MSFRKRSIHFLAQFDESIICLFQLSFQCLYLVTLDFLRCTSSVHVEYYIHEEFDLAQYVIDVAWALIAPKVLNKDRLSALKLHSGALVPVLAVLGADEL